MSNIFENYQNVIKNINEICEKTGRNVSDITIVAVSKTFPVEVIKEAYDCGIRIFGENYAQELRKKVKFFESYDISWHFIGRIQLNKLKYIVPVVDLIHSVSRFEEMKEIDKLAERFNKVQKILVQVNVSGEPTKSGLKVEEVEEFVGRSKEYKNTKIIGLMTMAPFTKDEKIIKNVFSTLRNLRDRLEKNYPDIKHLSMGMSNDYLIAVEEGATILRIGSAIFGERKYS
ncbi:YggS family pyridoxal phosphate-dependent enzyme [Thermosipho atlanticus]|uniref:Pyridoxal phosphate homeostasis protein n=1 Tax=Thermosipho atlanticus DSM 15807 TaxID=1123380 RepID=A0A1M5R533_9BACT|nr:YggS family pyridoxal phosphate-dependent enzyme [Thermosipho atlanticus]SHH21099.1 hypothetical protein SAMN02745199_0325 [Thermosipho atlanticus DSM 15807]